MDQPARGPAFWWATFFGSGLFPRAPGTVGTVASMVLWAPVVLNDLPWWARLLLVGVVFVTGTWAADRAAVLLGKDDPKEVVIDEVAGQGVALLFAPALPWTLVVGFVLFRIFDIAKPWPVSWADRKVHGGLGIMLDDILAGGYALLIMTLLLRYGGHLSLEVTAPWLFR